MRPGLGRRPNPLWGRDLRVYPFYCLEDIWNGLKQASERETDLGQREEDSGYGIREYQDCQGYKAIFPGEVFFHVFHYFTTLHRRRKLPYRSTPDPYRNRLGC